MENYDLAKEMFLEGKSLRSIGEELGINRKKLSLLLRKENLHTDKSMNDDKVNQAIKMINSGKKITHVAKELCVDRHTLSKELEKRQLRKPQNYKRKITKYDSQIVTMYTEDKISIEDISKELGISTNAVWNCLIENGLNDPSRTSAIYTYNTYLFKEIRTEGEAYWLGFLFADGYIDQYEANIEFHLQKRDEEHVKKFMRFISDDKRNSYDKKNSGHISHRINIHSKELAQNLVKCGCVNNKSFIKKFPKNDIVPDDLMHHFIRGYFDGNGCASKIQNNGTSFSIICASYDFIFDLYEYLIVNTSIKRNTIHVRLPEKENYHEVYVIRNSSKKDIAAIYNYLYKDATIYLDRKKQKFI